MTTTWTKGEHRDPKRREPIFCDGDVIFSHVQFANGVATLPESARDVAADVLLVEEDKSAGMRLHSFQFRPQTVERRWALFGLRIGEGGTVDLRLRNGRAFFYGAPRRAEHRLAVLRPGEVTRVLHNAKNDFSASSGRERTYRWNDFVIEPLGAVKEVRYGDIAEEWRIPLGRAKTVDLREDLL